MPPQKQNPKTESRVRRMCVGSRYDCLCYTFFLLVKLTRLLICTALVSSVLLCTNQGSRRLPSTIFSGLFLVAKDSFAQIADHCQTVADGLLNRSPIMLLFLLIMPWHNSFMQHAVDCVHPARKWDVVVVVVVQQTLWVRAHISFGHEKHPSIRLGLGTKHFSPE